MLRFVVRPFQTSDFDFVLPSELIAQTPSVKRDASRLLLVTGQSYHHHLFSQLPELLERHVGEQALLVFNDTQVIPARLHGHKMIPHQSTLGGKIELLLCEPTTPSSVSPKEWKETWRCLVRNGQSLKSGNKILILGENPPTATVLFREVEGTMQIEFQGTEAGGLLSAISRLGHIPLPPYIKRNPETEAQTDDLERYQTVYARHPGAVAAPTAGLHFTQELLQQLLHRGFRSAFVTLHVGPGTFAPIKTEQLNTHIMHRERYHIPRETVVAIKQAKQEGRKILAVGTTVVRTLESATPLGTSAPTAGFGETQMFIYPPYQFRCVEAMITNFHLPKSTLLMLVSAFAGKNRVLAAYAEAILQKYRFFSYGDAMLIPTAMADQPRDDLNPNMEHL